MVVVVVVEWWSGGGGESWSRGTAEAVERDEWLRGRCRGETGRGVYERDGGRVRADMRRDVPGNRACSIQVEGQRLARLLRRPFAV
jgi:hypothetical protein